MLNKLLQYKYFFLVALLVAPALFALLKPGYFPMHDDIQGMRVLQMQKCLLDFQIPCRWVPDMGFGYGYPQFNYYAPLPYYFMGIISLFGFSILGSVKIGFIASMLLSALAMFALGKKLWGDLGGVVSALIYTYAPYRAVDIYVRGAMGEAWAFVFLPLILLFSLEVQKNKKYTLPLAISLAGLALSHNITVIMFAPFYVLFVLFFVGLSKKSIFNLAISGIWGVCFSAFFVLPAFFEKSFVHVETILQGYFNYLAHFVGIKQLFFSSFWGYGSSTLGNLDGMSLSIGILVWVVPAIVLGLLLYLNMRKSLASAFLIFILGIMAVFFVHPRSQFVWDRIEIFSYIQFPWRFIALVILFFSISAGAIGKIVSDRKTLVVGFFAILILFYGSFFAPSAYLDISDRQKFSGENLVQQQTISIFDYLPKGAKAPPSSAAPNGPFSEDLEIEIIGSSLGTDWQVWEVDTPEDVLVRFPTFDFPVWTATVNGASVAVESDNDLGLISLRLPSGRSVVDLNLKDTPLRTASNLISLFAILSISYYVKKIRE